MFPLDSLSGKDQTDKPSPGRPIQLTVVVQAGGAVADAVASGTATPQPSAATLAAMSAHRMNLRMVIAALT